MKFVVLATGLLGAANAQSDVCQSPTELAKKISESFSAYKQQAVFRCDYGTRGEGPLEAWVAEEAAKREIVALCPELPWSEINVMAQWTREADQAVQVGTCTEYQFEVARSTFTASAVAGLECTTAPQTISLQACIEKAVCMKIGKQSTACSPTYSAR